MWSKALLPVMVVSALATMVGCATPPGEEETGGSTSAIIDDKQDGAPTDHPEVVQVLVNNTAKDYCTGVLVSATKVLTAAHCAGKSYTIIAPFAPGKPQSAATRGAVAEHSSAFNEEVQKEDAAVLILKTPIHLTTYATVREVGELGTKKLTGVAVGRSHEDRNAPLVKSVPLAITSGTESGYETGLHSEYYSSGGDSGGPLFLVENGKITHTVIGIERQPDPENNDEWFTRITPKVSALVK
ncbi:MAG: trypsin-like serine protease [Labilithrix sp.]